MSGTSHCLITPYFRKGCLSLTMLLSLYRSSLWSNGVSACKCCTSAQLTNMLQPSDMLGCLCYASFLLASLLGLCLVSVSTACIEPHHVAPAIPFIAWSSGHANRDKTKKILCTDPCLSHRGTAVVSLLGIIQALFACHCSNPCYILLPQYDSHCMTTLPSATFPMSSQMKLLAMFSWWHDHAIADDLP